MPPEGVDKISELHTPMIDKEIQKFSDCIDDCKTIPDITKKLIDIDLFQKEHQNTLGIPGISHLEQSENVLKSTPYWKLSNLKKTLEIKREIVGKGMKEFASFSVGGSIGAGYLGYLTGVSETGKMPEVIFGASAGSLFPMLFLLWKQAIKDNPKETNPSLEGLLSYLPNDLGDKTMWKNGEELIDGFRKAGQSLIDIVNRGRHIVSTQLPNIDNITLGDISPTFAVIASRKRIEGGFQEVIFSGKDNLLNSIIASSNPEVSVLGMKFSVLTNTKNKFLGNTWHDADHTNNNPTDYAEILGISKCTQIVALPMLKKGSARFNESMKSKQFEKLTSEDRANILEQTCYYAFQVPSKVSGKVDGNDSDYKITDQNDGWDKDTMYKRARLSYSKFLTGDMDNGDMSYLNLNLIINQIHKLSDFPNSTNATIERIRGELERRELPKEDVQDIFDGYALANTILGNKYLSEKNKKDLILSIFYEDGLLRNQHLSSELLPIIIPESKLFEKIQIESYVKQFNPSNLTYLLKEGKLPKDYLNYYIPRASKGKDFENSYHKMSKYIPDEFFSRNFDQLHDELSSLGLLYMIVSEPRLGKFSDLIARSIFEKPENHLGAMDESFYVVTKKLLSIIKDPELKKLIIVGYAKILDSRIKRSEKELDELKKIPKF